jgi:fructokinase
MRKGLPAGIASLKVDYPIICFGEILYKVLPSGTVPEGSILNVAYHLKQLGINPAIITRVGQDDPGRHLINLIDKYGISTEFLQMDFELETGRMHVKFRKGDAPIYDIVYPASWDNIIWDKDFTTLFAGSPCLLFGSLITRSNISRETLYRLMDLAGYRVLDLNCRSFYFRRPVIESLLSRVQLLMLNLEDLELITGWFADYRQEDDRIKAIQGRFNIPHVAVNRGANGAILNAEGVFYKHPGYRQEVMDSVIDPGISNDAFLAGLLTGLFENKKPADALAFACALDAVVADCNEACPSYDPEEINQVMTSGRFNEPGN